MADEYGTVGLGGSVDGDVTFHFCYQATENFTVKVNTGQDASISATLQELGAGQTTLSVSGSAVNLPGSTFAYVKITVTGGTTTYLS